MHYAFIFLTFLTWYDILRFMIPEEKQKKNIARYVLLGSFLGGLVGTTVVLLTLSESTEERKNQIKEIQRELLRPVSVKLSELVDQIGEAFKRALEDASSKKG